MSRPRKLATTTILASAFFVAGCGSPGNASAGSAGASSTGGVDGQPGATARAGSSYAIVPAAEVTAGLADVQKLAADAKAQLTSDPAAAKQSTKAMYDRWYDFEGTVRKNDKSLYLPMEDGLAAIKAGVEQNDPTKVDRGINDLQTSASQYLAKFP
ncbi:MAG: hypothetical protein HYX32_10655 [Actinobacteria bacterium]|nr:hypothetical protein [Actinomycetota bacterium]